MDVPTSSSSSSTAANNREFYEPRVSRLPAQPPMARLPPGLDEPPDSPDSVPLARPPPGSGVGEGVGPLAPPPVARLPPGPMPVPTVVNTARLPPGFEHPPSTTLPPPPPLRDDDDDDPVLSPFEGPTYTTTTNNNTSTNIVINNVPSMSAFYTKPPATSNDGNLRSFSLPSTTAHFLPPARLPRTSTATTPTSSASGIGRSLSTTKHHLPPALTPRAGVKKPGGFDGSPAAGLPISRLPMLSGIDYDDVTGNFVYDDSQKSHPELSSSTNNNNYNNNARNDDMVPDNFKSKMPEPPMSHVPESEVSKAVTQVFKSPQFKPSSNINI